MKPCLSRQSDSYTARESIASAKANNHKQSTVAKKITFSPPKMLKDLKTTEDID